MQVYSVAERCIVRARGSSYSDVLQSCFVECHDGTKLAVDVLLPMSYRGTHALPCVLYQARYETCYQANPPRYYVQQTERQLANCQCRYTRGVYLRFPFRLMSNSRPYDFVNISQKAELLLAGYAVVSMDFRGTGTTCLPIQ